MKQQIQICLIGFLAMTVTACGGQNGSSETETIPYYGSPSYLNPKAAIVKGRAIITFDGSERGQLTIYSNPQTRMSGSLTDTDDQEAIVISMGTFKLTDLFDQDFSVCNGGNSRCTSAFIRIYTSDGGSPFSVRSNRNSVPRRVGVEHSGALILESSYIEEGRQSLNLSDLEDTEYEILLERNFRPRLNDSAVLYVEYVVSH